MHKNEQSQSVLVLLLGPAIAALLLSAACGAPPPAEGLAEGESPEAVVVPESWIVDDYAEDNVDAPALWAEREWLFATGKVRDRLLVFDASRGELIDELRLEGEEAFGRPNGVAVHGDLLFVVERDGARVSVISLPGMELLGTFGGEVLVKPYSLAIHEPEPDTLRVYVTDDFDPPGLLGGDGPGLDERVRLFELRLGEGGFEARLVKSFGESEGPGAIEVAESVEVDPAFDRVLLAEEKAGDTHLLVYDLEGAFTGQVVGGGLFSTEAEGIALAECGQGGYWIATDQHPIRTRFLVFERESLEYVGAFVGEETSNTDGVTLYQGALEAFPKGAFFAVHDDRGVAAFDWHAVLDALGLSCER